MGKFITFAIPTFLLGKLLESHPDLQRWVTAATAVETVNQHFGGRSEQTYSQVTQPIEVNWAKDLLTVGIARLPVREVLKHGVVSSVHFWNCREGERESEQSGSSWNYRQSSRGIFEPFAEQCCMQTAEMICCLIATQMMDERGE